MGTVAVLEKGMGLDKAVSHDSSHLLKNRTFFAKHV